MIVLFENYWGGLTLEATFKKIDLLPRVTISQLSHIYIINIGFLMLTLNLSVWDEAMRDMLRKHAEKGANSEDCE